MRRGRTRPPWAIVPLAALAALYLVLPFLALLQRAPWSDLPQLLTTDVVGDALRLSITTALAALVALAVVAMGATGMFRPQFFTGFGIPGTSADDPVLASWLTVKGRRDIGTGLMLLVVTLLGTTALSGWVMLAAVVMPVFDGLIVLRHPPGDKRTSIVTLSAEGKQQFNRLARAHNDATVAALGARMHSIETATALVETFLATRFSGDPRHVRRIAMLTAYEQDGTLPPLPVT